MGVQSSRLAVVGVFTLWVSGCCMSGAGGGAAPTDPAVAPVVAAPVALPPLAPVSAEAAARAVAASHVLQSGPWGSMYVPSLWGASVGASPPVPGATPVVAFAYQAPDDPTGEAIFVYTSPRAPTDSPVSLVATATTPAGFTADAPVPDTFYPGFDVGKRAIHQDTVTSPHGGYVAAFARGNVVYWLVCYTHAYSNDFGGMSTACDTPFETFRPPAGM